MAMSTVTAPAAEASETSPPSQASYSAKLQLNVNRNERLKRNVLEINLETDDKTFVARLLTCIGINYNTQAEAIQTCTGNSRKIFVWLKDSCDISRFCKEESYQVMDGVKTGLIKPMDRT